jgi:prophage endopeptidase
MGIRYRSLGEHSVGFYGYVPVLCFAGTLKLRIPVQSPVCPVHTASDAPSAPRDSVQTNAELDREVAKSLVAITDDGDKAIRQLNACIDAYNTVYQTLKETK